MQRPQVSPDARELAPDAGAVLGTALRRLALLRAQLRGDWSDGPATLPAWANSDGEDPWGEVAWTPREPEPLILRGRFETIDDIAQVASPDIEVSDETEAADEAIVAAAFAEDLAALDPPAPAPLAGAAEGLLAFLDRLPSEPAPLILDEPEDVEAYGAVANLVALLDLPDLPRPSAPRPTPPSPATPDDFHDIGAYGSAPLPPITPDTPDPTPIPALVAEEHERVPADLAAGAHAGLGEILRFLDAQAPAPLPPASTPATTDDTPSAFAFGAAPLAALFDATPPEVATVILTRPFDPAVLIDDALADAFDALLGALGAIAADDVVWDFDATPACNAVSALAACEAALWDIPRHVPCLEIFTATPNHETAVRLTRTLRLRAQALEARAFAENADFGALVAAPGDDTLWFTDTAMSNALPADVDADACFADWQSPGDEFVTISAPDIAPRRPAALPQPIVTEEELDALFAHIEENQRVVLDDLGDEARWSEPYWSDVDSYLAHVAETMDPALLDPPDPLAPVEMYDIEVRDPEPTLVAATHFWMPGDDGDLVVEGDGDDLFIVGGGEDSITVLVEDGATWTMRTGGAARMDEVVVSLSDDAWSDVDAMSWRRIATLSGVAQLRVEQNPRGSRRLAISGTLLATDLDEGDVRLVRSGDDGEEEFEVIRSTVSLDWSFAEATGTLN